MDLKNISLQSIDIRGIGMLNACAMVSVLVAIFGLGFGFLMSLAERDSAAVTIREGENVQARRQSTATHMATSPAAQGIPRSGSPTRVSQEVFSATTTNLLGDWFLNRRSIGGRIRIYESTEDENRVFIDRTFHDGRRELRNSLRHDDKILSDPPSVYIINSNGDLECREDSKLVWTARKQ